MLQWIIDRCENRTEARETPIGYLPKPEGINIDGLDIEPETMASLLSVDAIAWLVEYQAIGEYLEGYGSRLPAELAAEQAKALDALG